MEKIFVHSYKGGTGKTTVAVNLASILAHKQKVLLIENDFSMPSLFNIFRSEPEIYFNDYLNENVEFNEAIVSDIGPNLDVIFANKNFNPMEKIMGSDQEWFLDLLGRMLKDLKALEKVYKYVIFDSPPGWHMNLVNLITLSNKAILILRPNSYEVNGTMRLLEILYKRAKPRLGLDVYLVFNQVPEVDMVKDLEQWADDFHKDGIKYAGHISCSCTTSYEMAHGTTIFDSDHVFTQSLQKIISVVTSP
ncbi:MAG: tyrosine-protein kinase family protein [Candidatus Hodarchaeales archaeon]|jgi:MinD-like ATPase involved in chromosome partitioning or flagellar assembly